MRTGSRTESGDHEVLSVALRPCGSPLTEDLARLALEKLGFRVIDARPKLRTGKKTVILDGLARGVLRGREVTVYLEVKAWRRAVGRRLLERLDALLPEGCLIAVAAYEFNGEAREYARRREGRFLLLPADAIEALTGVKVIRPPAIGAPAAIIMAVLPENFSRLRMGSGCFISGSVRRRLRPGMRVYFYVNEPVAELKAVAEVAEYLVGEPREIWRAVGEECGWSEEEFKAFVRGRRRISAIIYRNMRPLPKALSRSELLAILGLEWIGPLRAGHYIDAGIERRLREACGLSPP